jgi:hypothetical protein
VEAVAAVAEAVAGVLSPPFLGYRIII